MKHMNDKPKESPPYARDYRKTDFYWAVMYKPSARAKPHIICIYPRHRDAVIEAMGINRRWKEQGFGDQYFSVMRFRFRFKGVEIDAYQHIFERNEKR